ncbi:hypothetical protein LCGC14_1788570, partial [marine sediment metagenome]
TLRDLADQCRRCGDPPCRGACPAGVDIPSFLDAVAEGDFHSAYKVVRESLLLPGACGAVCPSDVTCGSECIRQVLGQSTVAVGEIHRYVGDIAVRQGWAALEVPSECTGRRVAVIGAGPAGLACTSELLLRGHKVSVFDRAACAGGKLASVIPAARIARGDLQAEIEATFGSVSPDRLTWRAGAPLGPGPRFSSWWRWCWCPRCCCWLRPRWQPNC